MALALKPVWSLTYTIEDRDTNDSTVTLYIDQDILPGPIELAMTGYYTPAIGALTNGIIRRATLSRVWEDTTATLAPEESDVQRKGIFTFTAANGAPYKMEIPSLKNTVVVDRTNIIDPNNADVQNLIAYVLSSGPLALSRPRTYLGSDIQKFNGAKKHHRGSSKG